MLRSLLWTGLTKRIRKAFLTVSRVGTLSPRMKLMINRGPVSLKIYITITQGTQIVELRAVRSLKVTRLFPVTASPFTLRSVCARACVRACVGVGGGVWLSHPAVNLLVNMSSLSENLNFVLRIRMR